MAAAEVLGSMANAFGGAYFQHQLNKEAADEAYYKQRNLLAAQQSFAQKQIDKQYNYNDLSSQIQRLEENGLNKNLVYGSGMTDVLAPQTATTSAPSAPQAQPVDVANMMLASANVVKAIAEAKKAGAEAAGQNLENQYNQATMEERVKAVGLQNSWTEEQTAKMTQEVSYIVGQQNALQVQIDNLRKEGKLTDKEIKWFDQEMSAKIAELKSSADYQRAQANLTKTQKEQLDALFDDTKRLLSSNANLAEKTVTLLDRYGDAQAIVGMATQLLGSISDLLKFKFPIKK